VSGLERRNPLTELTAAQAAAVIREGGVSSEEYTTALLAEADARSELNLFTSLEPDTVLEAARRADAARASGAALGPLHGVPIAVKDSIHTAGRVTTNGTASMRAYVPTRDADILTPLAAAGALVLGKTGLTEISFGWTSNNGAFGAVRNPYDPTLVPGGSSGGSAAAVAARVAPLAIGADTLGSIQIPASFCGVVGFRPTLDRYPNRGSFGLTRGLLDQLGPMARSVEDVALFDAVVAGGDPLPAVRLAGTRVGIPAFYTDGIESTVAEVWRGALDALRDAGLELVDIDVPDELREAFGVSAAIMLFDAMPSITAYLETYDVGLDLGSFVEQLAPAKREFFEQVAMPPGRPPEEAYRGAVARRPALAEALERYLAEHDLAALALPAVGAPPPHVGEEHHVHVDGAEVSFFDAFGRNTALSPATGAPALVLPAALSSTGLPVGFELIGARGADRGLLALGTAVEGVLGFDGPDRPAE